jgi:hypothetical protein
MLNCRCVTEGLYCDKAREWVVTIAQLGNSYNNSLVEENRFVDAWQAWNFHMHDVDEARKALRLPLLTTIQGKRLLSSLYKNSRRI